MDLDRELQVRLRVVDHLRSLREQFDGAVPSAELEKRLDVDGESIALMSRQRGIHAPAQLSAALTVKTSHSNPYEDDMSGGYDGLVRYHYREPSKSTALAAKQAAADNAAVRRALEHKLPIAYLWGVDKGWYLPFAPVQVVGESPVDHEFMLDVTELSGLDLSEVSVAAESIPRKYQSREVRQRVHQARFRQMVMRAYRRACSMCELRHERLLDAAHIISDTEGGEPTITNGIALCKIHHAAFDQNVLGIRPDLIVMVNDAVLHEVDGPMLQHGLKDFHEQRLRVIPARAHQRPEREALEKRYEEFLVAG